MAKYVAEQKANFEKLVARIKNMPQIQAIGKKLKLIQ